MSFVGESSTTANKSPMHTANTNKARGNKRGRTGTVSVARQDVPIVFVLATAGHCRRRGARLSLSSVHE